MGFNKCRYQKLGYWVETFESLTPHFNSLIVRRLATNNALQIRE